MRLTLVRQRVTIQTLRLACAVEKEVCDTHDDVVEDLGCSNQVDEPLNSLRGARADGKEREEGEEHGDEEADPRDAVLRCPPKDLGCLTIERKAVEGASGHIDIGVAGCANSVSNNSRA